MCVPAPDLPDTPSLVHNYKGRLYHHVTVVTHDLLGLEFFYEVKGVLGTNQNRFGLWVLRLYTRFSTDRPHKELMIWVRVDRVQ